jgi:predicted nucleotidyltransferase
MPAIRKLAREIAEKFQPEKIILFGSYAYGTPHQDSDVDLLVVMPASNESSKACRILNTIVAPFPIDLIVRTPKNLAWRLKAGDWFLREIVANGKVLYEGPQPPVDAEGGERPASRTAARESKAAVTRLSRVLLSASGREILQSAPARKKAGHPENP